MLSNCWFCWRKIIRKWESSSNFCDANCRSHFRYHNIPKVRKNHFKCNKKRYKKLKNNKQFAKKRTEYFEKWRKINPEKFRESMRNIMRKRNKTKPENYRISKWQTKSLNFLKRQKDDDRRKSGDARGKK